MYEMKYLRKNDMPYFRKLAEAGKAIIIEFSDQVLFNVDFKHFREPTGEIAGKNLEEILRKQESILKEKSDEGLKLYQEIRGMEELLQKESEVEKEEPAAQAERMKKMLEDMIRSCMQGTSTDR